MCIISASQYYSYNLHTHTSLMALFPGLPRWAGTRKVKPIWILLKQETVSGSGISWAICKSASRSRQITMPAPHHSVFYRPDALPAAQPTASKHWRQSTPCHKCTGRSGRVVSMSDCGVRGPRFKSHHGWLCLLRKLLRYAALGTGCTPFLQCLGWLSLPPSVGR